MLGNALNRIEHSSSPEHRLANGFSGPPDYRRIPPPSIPIIAAIVVLEQCVEKPATAIIAIAAGIVITAVTAMVMPMRIAVVRLKCIRDLSNDSRSCNGPEHTNGNSTHIRNHLHLLLRLRFLLFQRQTLGRTNKRLTALGTIRIAMRRKRPAKHALHDEPRRTCRTFLRLALMKQTAIGAGDTFTRRVCRIRRSAETTNHDASLPWRTAMIAGRKRHGRA